MSKSETTPEEFHAGHCPDDWKGSHHPDCKFAKSDTTTFEVIPQEPSPEMKKAVELVAEIRQMVVSQMKIPDWMLHNETLQEEVNRRQYEIRREVYRQCAPIYKIMGEILALEMPKMIVRKNVET